MAVSLDALSKKHGRLFVLHVVASGENLSRIAAKYNTSIPMILKHNSIIKDKSHIEPGWKLEIPDERPGKQNYVQHLVTAGEKLGDLVRTYATTVEAVMDLNPSVTNPNLIRAGATLKIPDNR
ncbi:MAG: LysM peptidoglycan-binding domain-containing protein [Christensenella sp.]|nr:LysM peptidoglycan-binding domain-containing protein [Christensenella sp.]